MEEVCSEMKMVSGLRGLLTILVFALSLWLNYGQFTMALLWHGMRGIGGLSLKRTPDLRL